jgi:hypothetical protein
MSKESNCIINRWNDLTEGSGREDVNLSNFGNKLVRLKAKRNCV